MNNILLNGKVVNKNTNEWTLNCACVYNGKNTAYLTLENVKYAVEWFKANSVYMQVITINNLEPVLHPEILEIIDECKKICKNLQLNINPILLTEDFIQELIKRGVRIKPQNNVGENKSIRNNMCAPNLKIKEVAGVGKEIIIEIIVELICAFVMCLFERCVL